MKNIIISLIFASLVFGLDLEPTKSKSVMDIYNDLKSDLKEVEAGSDDYKILLGMLCNIEAFHNEAIKENFDLEKDGTKECKSSIFEPSKVKGSIYSFTADLDAKYYSEDGIQDDFPSEPELIERNDCLYGDDYHRYMNGCMLSDLPRYGLKLQQKINGDFIFRFIYLHNYSHNALAGESEETLKKIDENSIALSEKFQEKYLTQNSKYIGEKISKEQAVEFLNLLAENVDFLEDFNYARGYWHFVPKIQNVYGDKFYISDKACLNLNKEISDESNAGASYHLKFENGADYDSKECSEIFKDTQIQEFLTRLNETPNRFMLKVNWIDSDTINLNLADYSSGIVCDFGTGIPRGLQNFYKPEEYKELFSDKLIFRIFDDDDDDNDVEGYLGQNFKVAIFSSDELGIRKGKYNTGIMFGNEELIVNVTEKGVKKLFEKPNENKKSPKIRCQIIGH